MSQMNETFIFIFRAIFPKWKWHLEEQLLPKNHPVFLSLKEKKYAIKKKIYLNVYDNREV